MAAITPALLDALFRQYQFQFTSMYNATPTYWPSFASEMPSGSSENVYAWLEQFSGMRQWQGSRQVKSAIGRDYRLTNIPFELTVGLPRAKIADDQHGFFGAVIENMGMSTKQLPDQRLSLAVEAGTTALCWDGQPFFADAHPDVRAHQFQVGRRDPGHANLIEGAAIGTAAVLGDFLAEDQLAQHVEIFSGLDLLLGRRGRGRAGAKAFIHHHLLGVMRPALDEGGVIDGAATERRDPGKLLGK